MQIKPLIDPQALTALDPCVKFFASLAGAARLTNEWLFGSCSELSERRYIEGVR